LRVKQFGGGLCMGMNEKDMEPIARVLVEQEDPETVDGWMPVHPF
jgi:hypothetical protein